MWFGFAPFIDVDEAGEDGFVPVLEKLAREINPDDKRSAYLHAAQLIKHILGLKACCGNKDFRLLDLWYDVLGKEGADHRVEVEDFTSITKSDGIHFHGMTYQELINSVFDWL